MVKEFPSRGWARIGFDPAVARWAEQARVAGTRAMADPGFAQWWVCEDTWFVGVDALPNDETGAVGDGVPLGGAPKRAIETLYGAWPRLHKGQVSVVRPGYPRPRAGESAAAFRFRQKRDAAHVDGVKAVGPDRRRVLEERHQWILGLPLTENTAAQSPMVVWEGSHEIMRAALLNRLAGVPEEDWARQDVTEIYQQTRRQIFETCPRVPVTARPGEAYLIHRLALHGVAPWTGQTGVETHGDSLVRMVAYFRPDWTGSVGNWLKHI